MLFVSIVSFIFKSLSNGDNIKVVLSHLLTSQNKIESEKKCESSFRNILLAKSLSPSISFGVNKPLPSRKMHLSISAICFRYGWGVILSINIKWPFVSRIIILYHKRQFLHGHSQQRLSCFIFVDLKTQLRLSKGSLRHVFGCFKEQPIVSSV